jgi:DNA-binding phage protein
MDDFSYVLKQLRDPNRKKPVEQIADEAGVAYFTIQKWMGKRGTRNPRFQTVQKLSSYFRREEKRQLC